MPEQFKSERKKRRDRRDDPEQSRAFIEAARKLGVDEDASAADEIMGRLAKRPPTPRKADKAK